MKMRVKPIIFFIIGTFFIILSAITAEFIEPKVYQFEISAQSDYEKININDFRFVLANSWFINIGPIKFPSINDKINLKFKIGSNEPKEISNILIEFPNKIYNKSTSLRIIQCNKYYECGNKSDIFPKDMRFVSIEDRTVLILADFSRKLFGSRLSAHCRGAAISGSKNSRYQKSSCESD